jgi:hypothetical protein
VLTRRDISTAALGLSACLVKGSIGVFDVEVRGHTHVGGGCVEGTMDWEERRKVMKRTRGGGSECCKSCACARRGKSREKAGHRNGHLCNNFQLS